MSYASEILERANAINTNAPASDLYLACKALTEAGIQNVPLTLAAAIRARVLSPQTTDPYELAFLLKAMSFLDLWATYGAWYIGGSNGEVRSIKNGVYAYPAQTSADLTFPQSALVLNSPGTFDFPGTQVFPTWYEDETLLRVRVWGAGGGGAGGTTNYDIGAAGGGGGYAESLVRFGDVRTGLQVTVGAGGAGGVNSSGGVGGGSSSFGSLLSATGGGGGLFDSSGASGTATTAATGGVGGAGVGGFFNATGGAGGSNKSSGSTTDRPGSGGGSAAGPWGNGFPGGGIDPVSGSAPTSAGGHSGAGTGAAGRVNASGAIGALGGESAAYNAAWFTQFLQTHLGGLPVPSTLNTTNARVTSGAGCGGSGQFFDSASGYLSAIYDGGAFGGGGGGATLQLSGTAAGHGGVAAGGGGAAAGNSCNGGNGGNGLIIIEWFV